MKEYKVEVTQFVKKSVIVTVQGKDEFAAELKAENMVRLSPMSYPFTKTDEKWTSSALSYCYIINIE